MLVNLLIRLRLLLFVVAFVAEPSALAANSIHGVSMATLVKVFWSLFGNFSLSFQLRTSRSAN